MAQVRLTIAGEPKPQGSKRHVGNGVMIEAAGQPLKVWRKAIASECKKQEVEKLRGPLEVEVEFYLPRPKSIKPAQRPSPIKPPDLDKLLRGLLDGIGQAGNIWEDDSQVVLVKASKAYADVYPSGAIVSIKSL